MSHPETGKTPENNAALTEALNQRHRERWDLGLRPKKYEIDAFQDGWEAAMRYRDSLPPVLVTGCPHCDHPLHYGECGRRTADGTVVGFGEVAGESCTCNQ